MAKVGTLTKEFMDHVLILDDGFHPRLLLTNANQGSRSQRPDKECLFNSPEKRYFEFYAFIDDGGSSLILCFVHPFIFTD